MSEIKVNKISPRSGTTVTLGDSGDTFTIPSGATINNQGTATNFGATGSASWTNFIYFYFTHNFYLSLKPISYYYNSATAS